MTHHETDYTVPFFYFARLFVLNITSKIFTQIHPQKVSQKLDQNVRSFGQKHDLLSVLASRELNRFASAHSIIGRKLFSDFSHLFLQRQIFSRSIVNE
jgi:competence protein ComGF